jgi:hypothetical protein
MCANGQVAAGNMVGDTTKKGTESAGLSGNNTAQGGVKQ